MTSGRWSGMLCDNRSLLILAEQYFCLGEIPNDAHRARAGLIFDTFHKLIYNHVICRNSRNLSTSTINTGTIEISDHCRLIKRAHIYCPILTTKISLFHVRSTICMAKHVICFLSRLCLKRSAEHPLCLSEIRLGVVYVPSL